MERHKNNPIITRKMIPSVEPHLVDVSGVFNPGAVLYKDQVILLLRVQNRGRESFILKAASPDGINFTVSDKPVIFWGMEELEEKVYHCYDPRITRIGNIFYIMFAMDMEKHCTLGLARTFDFESYEFLGVTDNDDIRNGVLFPEKHNNKYLRLDRPNRKKTDNDGPFSGDTIFLSQSDDLLHWEEVGPVISGRWRYWDELIGAGPPPIKTDQGWLQLYHGVATHFSSSNIYQAGVMLLDIQDPSKVLARGKYNILEPRERYELMGQVPNVVFPSGAVALKNKVHVYYGAADTSVGLAVTSINELIQAARM